MAKAPRIVVKAGTTDPGIRGGKVSKDHAPRHQVQKGFQTRNNG